ncbi:MAG: ABC transporter family substrate-binding protein [Actinomycetota bacterium]|nr:ABC transporter family substrate-binding protein [Actinomycetota bacterium]
MALVLAACGGGDDDDDTSSTDETDTQGITIAAEQELTNFNQNTSADNLLWGAMIVRLVWPQMYFQTPDFKLEPGFMADGPAEVVTEDPFTVRWKINPDAVWSDGTPVSSDDLEYYWQSCNGAVDEGEPVDPEDPEATAVDCVSTDGYDQVTQFTKVDEKTAEAVFSGPIAEFDSLFSNPIPPAHIARAEGEDAWGTAFIDSPIVSAGPYTLGEYVKGESLTLERNEEFYGEPANLETITFRFIEEPGQMVDALRNGEVDLIYPQPQTDTIPQVEEIPDVASTISFGPTWEHLTFNFANTALADAAVRQAILLGTNRVELVDILMKPFSEEATVLNNRIFMNGNDGYQNNAGDVEEYDIDAANAVLDDAGWVEGSDGIREKDGERLALRIITTGGNTLREDTEELLQSQYAELGIELTIDNRPGSDAFDVIFGAEETAADWDIALFAWVGTVTPAISSAPVYGTGQGNNPGGYTNPEVDTVFAEAIAELDQTRRFELLNEADAMMWAPTELPDIPLYQKPTHLAYLDKYANIVDNTTSEGFTWNAEQWEIVE